MKYLYMRGDVLGSELRHVQVMNKKSADAIWLTNAQKAWEPCLRTFFAFLYLYTNLYNLFFCAVIADRCIVTAHTWASIFALFCQRTSHSSPTTVTQTHSHNLREMQWPPDMVEKAWQYRFDIINRVNKHACLSYIYRKKY